MDYVEFYEIIVTLDSLLFELLAHSYPRANLCVFVSARNFLHVPSLNIS